MNKAGDGTSEDAPAYPSFGVHIGWVWQGAAQLLPWYVFLVGHAYISQRVAHTPGVTDYAVHLAIIFAASRLLLLICGIYIVQKSVRPASVVSCTIAVNVCLLAITYVYSVVVLNNQSQVRYNVLLLLVTICSLVSSFIDANHLAVLASFPASCAQAYIIGHGIACVPAALFHFAAAGAQSNSNSFSMLKSVSYAAIYFGGSLLTVAASWLVLAWMSRQPFFQWHYQRSLLASNAHPKSNFVSTSPNVASIIQSAGHVMRLTWDIFTGLLLSAMATVIVVPNLLFMTHSALVRPTAWLPRNWVYGDMFHVLALVVYSLFALAGRVAAGFAALQPAASSRVILGTNAVRMLIIPAVILLGNVCVSTEFACLSLRWGPLYRSDIMFYITLGLDATLGGYSLGCAVLQAPRRVARSDRSRAMAQIAYGIGLGTLVGAVISYYLQLLLSIVAV